MLKYEEKNHIIFHTHTHTQHALNIYGAEKIKKYIYKMMREEREGGLRHWKRGSRGGTFWKEAQAKPHVFILFHAPQSNNQQTDGGKW